MTEQQNTSPNPFSSNEGKYVGNQKIVKCVKSKENTPGGFPIYELTYEGVVNEWISENMLKNVVSEEPCNLSDLREKRVNPVVQMCLAVIRDYGIKLSELPDLSVKLNNSLDFNYKEALRGLWSEWMPIPTSSDDIDMLAVDRALKYYGLKEKKNVPTDTKPKEHSDRAPQ